MRTLSDAASVGHELGLNFGAGDPEPEASGDGSGGGLWNGGRGWWSRWRWNCLFGFEEGVGVDEAPAVAGVAAGGAGVDGGASEVIAEVGDGAEGS